MRVIGVAGGVASGKSLVARLFQHLGAAILDADRLGHEVLTLPEVKRQIQQLWGEPVFDNGEINRSALAKIVFGQEQDRDQLRLLEQITHPEIRRKLEKQLSEMRQRDEYEVVVLDAPVMFKAGWDELCDEIVFVDVELSTRIERAMASRGWSADEITKRERLQVSLAEKMKRATVFVNNSGSVEETFRQVTQIWSDWGLQVPDEVLPTDLIHKSH